MAFLFKNLEVEGGRIMDILIILYFLQGTQEAGYCMYTVLLKPYCILSRGGRRDRILHGYSNPIILSPGEAGGRILQGFSNPIILSPGEAGGRILQGYSYTVSAKKLAHS